MIPWKVRKNTQDFAIIQEVYFGNCYNVGYLSGWTVIDVGANIGCFSVLALDRNAELVYAFEADEENAKIAAGHVASHARSECASVSYCAVVGEHSGLEGKTVSMPRGYHSDHGVQMTGGKNIFDAGKEDDRQTVDCVSIYHVIKAAAHSGNKVFLKLDCEGSEHGILHKLTNLHLVDKIAGECHTIGVGFDPFFKEEQSITTLARGLKENGFQVKVKPYDGTDAMCMFWAVRS